MQCLCAQRGAGVLLTISANVEAKPDRRSGTRRRTIHAAAAVAAVRGISTWHPAAGPRPAPDGGTATKHVTRTAQVEQFDRLDTKHDGYLGNPLLDDAAADDDGASSAAESPVVARTVRGVSFTKAEKPPSSALKRFKRASLSVQAASRMRRASLYRGGSQPPGEPASPSSSV